MKPKLYLYLLKQNDEVGYDAYDSCIVAAPDQETAHMMHPYQDEQEEAEEEERGYGISWPIRSERKEGIAVQLIGVAADDIEAGVICASFNAS